MDKLIEKLLTFIIVFSFLTLAFTIMNINMVEYKVKSSKIAKEENFMFKELVSTWLVDNTDCKDFGIYFEDDYVITECKKENDTVYYVDNHKKSTTITEDYFYKYNGDTNEFFVYSENPILDKIFIKNDFTQFLGIELTESKIKEQKSKYALIKQEDEKPELTFNLIKQDKAPTFLMIKK